MSNVHCMIHLRAELYHAGLIYERVKNEISVRKSSGRKERPKNKKKRRKVNWTGHILHRNCNPKHVTEGTIGGRIEVTGRRGIRCKQLLGDLTEKRW